MRIALLLALCAAPLAFAATPLTCGVAASGSVSANGTTSSFTFGGQVGDTMLIRIIPITPTVRFNPPVLQDPNGLNVKGGQIGTSPYFTYNLQTAGTYTYFISGTVTGGYTIAYVPLNRSCNANGALPCGVPTPISSVGPGPNQPNSQPSEPIMQSYQFNGKSGDEVVLHLSQAASSDPGSALVILGFDSTGEVFAVSPGSVGLGFVRKLTADGVQTLVVTENSGTLNVNYSLIVVNLTGPCAATALTCGSALDGAINAPLVTAAYTLNVNKGDVYLLRYVLTDTSGGLFSNVIVLDPTATPVVPLNTGDSSVLQYTFTASGTYNILIYDTNGTGTGKFSLSLTRLNSPCSTQAITCGSTTSGQISAPARFTAYALTAQAGDLYLLRLLHSGTGNFKPRIQIYGPDGSAVQNVSTTTLGQVSFNTPAGGAYLLLASDSYDGTQSGAYIFSLSRLNAPCSGATALTCGSLAPGSITQPLQAGTYSYPTAAGDSFTVRLLDTGGTLQTALQVYAPNTTGQPLPVVSGNTKAVDVTGALPGAYTIMVTDQSSNPQTGTFAIEAIGTRGACASSPPQGQSVNGLISGLVPFISYTFSAQQGEPLLLRLASFTPGFNASMDLYDTTGKRMGSSTTRLAAAAPSSGSYTAVIGANSPRTAGSYAFAWQLLDQPVATPLSCGQTVSGALSPNQQFSWYSLSASDSDLLKLVLSRLPTTTNAQVELFSPAGASLKTSATEIDETVSAGAYAVMVSPATANAETGGFALALQKPNNPCAAMNLTCGQTILQQVTTPGQVDAFTFTGNSGDAITITVTPRTGTYTPVAELYDPNGNLLGSLTTTLTSTGQYTLTVHDRAGSNTGSYRVGLQHTNTPCPEDDSQKPTISLVHPTGGEVIAGGTVYLIAWQSDDNVSVTQHTIQFSTDGGKTFAALPGGPASFNGVTQSYSWTVPAAIAPTRQAVIKVTATDKGGNTASAQSDLLTLIGSGFTPNETVTLSYDPLNRVIQATYSGGSTIFYNYDGDGNLIKILVQ